jgi:hypothetical protein
MSKMEERNTVEYERRKREIQRRMKEGRGEYSGE